MTSTFADLSIEPDDGIEVDVGKNIRLLRQRRGWTLTDTAQRLDIGRSTLAKVESASMSPTVGLLQKIALGFGVDVTELISCTKTVPGTGRLTVTYAGQGEQHRSHNRLHELLGAGLANKRMLPFHSRIKAAEKMASLPQWFRHDAEEFIFVLEGEVVLHSEHYAPTDLGPGDSVYLDGRMGHCFVGKNDNDAVVLFVLAEH